MKVLSIVIPYYNGGIYTIELLEHLSKQLTDEVEVILVDDGSPEPFKSKTEDYNYDWLTVIRQKNKRCAGARNTGIRRSSGEYIQFIDADDMIPDYFITRLLREIRENPFDVCDYSWKSLDKSGVQHNIRVQDREGRLSNPSVCTRCFSRTYIGKNRFNEHKDSTEDEDFSRKLGYLDPNRSCKHTAISDYMYFYRTSVENSKIKRFKAGLMNTKRIVYYYSHVTADMKSLLREIKEEDKTNEVWLLTNQCDIPELSRYCQISKPFQIWCHELRGEPFARHSIIEPPIQTQIVVYCEHCARVGGITTFIYNFCQWMKKYYDIMVIYERMDDMQIVKLSEIVRTVKYDPAKYISCDTLILNRLTDEIKPNITAKQTIQICHACKQINYRIPQNRDILVNVSEAAKQSWGAESEQGIVIHNLPYVRNEPCLMLVSATRTKTTDKGQNDSRMRKLAGMLESAGIKFIWLNFSDNPLPDMPKSFINMPAMANIQPFIAKADYLVQLSDAEAYSMSVLEALNLNTAVIATPFPSIYEEGFEEGKTGYIVPFDMKFDVTKLLNIPKFEYTTDTESIIKQWRCIIGHMKPSHKYKPEKLISITCIKKYKDINLGRVVNIGETILVTQSRAQTICSSGYATRRE